MKLVNFVASVAAAAVSITVASQASAATAPLWEWNSTGVAFTNGDWDLGQVFTANRTVEITALGYYDQGLLDGGAGFSGDHAVALYDSIGNLLASASVSSADAGIGHFRFARLQSPVFLTQGQTYTLNGQSGGDNYAFNDTGWAANSDISYVGYNYAFGAGDSFQGTWTANVGISDGFHGPNALVVAVPEPATWAMMLIG